MVKYLNILACSALAMFIASPASAEIINLYDLKNFLYYGKSNLGNGIKDADDKEVYKYVCDVSKWILPTSYSDLSKMSGCKAKKYPGGTNCYVGCECDKTRFPYTSDNCSGKYFVTGGEICEDTKGAHYASCSCSSNTIPDDISGILQIVFNGVVQRSAGVNGEVVCNVIENPSCKDGYVQLSELPSGTQISTGYDTYRRTIDSDRTPFSYELFGSNNRREPGTVYCINQTLIQNKFSGVVSFDDSSLNQSCAKVLYGTDDISRKAFAYYSGDCIDGTPKLCSTKSVTCMAYSSVDVNFYKPADNSLDARSCNYVSGCKTGVDTDDNFCALSAGTGVAFSSHTDQDITCLNITGCNTGYCSTDSSLITAIKPASELGYSSSASSCDGVELKHPLDTSASVCLPTSCGKLQSNTYSQVLAALGKSSSTSSAFIDDVKNAFCPYGLCTKGETNNTSLATGSVVVGSDGIEPSGKPGFPYVLSSSIPTSTNIYFKCKDIVAQSATRELKDCLVGDYVKLPQNDSPAVCSAKPLDNARNIVVSNTSSIIYISETNLSNAIKPIDTNGSSMSLYQAYQYIQENVNLSDCYPLYLISTEVGKARTILGRLLGKFVSDNNISPKPVYFYLGGVGGTDMFYASTGASNLISTRENVAPPTLKLYYVCGGQLSIE